MKSSWSCGVTGHLLRFWKQLQLLSFLNLLTDSLLLLLLYMGRVRQKVAASFAPGHPLLFPTTSK